MKLTKTEQDLLQRLQQRGRVAAEWIVGHGPEGGRINTGYRRYHACRLLADRGIAKVSSQWSRNDFNGICNYVIVIERV